jgi:hypothetical protein
MDSITITRPDDWHIHLRDGGALSIVEHERESSGGDPDRVEHAGSGASVGNGCRSSRGGIDTFDDDADEEDDRESAKLVRN